MKILSVIASMDPLSGGPCQGLRNMAPVLRKLGVKNEVVCLDDPRADFLSNEKIVIHALGRTNNGYNYSRKLRQWLLDNFARFDVIIVHGLWQYTSVGTVSAFKKYKRGQKEINIPRLFVMPHGMLDPWFQKAKERRWKALRNYFFWHFFEKNVVNTAEGLLFTCEQELLLARKTFSDYHPKREINIGYGIAPPPEYSENVTKFVDSNSLTKASSILFLSRIHPKKGVDLLVDAYCQVSAEYKLLGKSLPDLIIAGPGMETAYGKLVRENAKAHPQIHFPGMLQGNDKWNAFYECEVFILPSHQENFGIAVVEAMACGKAVLVSNQVNIYKEIEKGACGIIGEDSREGVVSSLLQWFSLTENEKKKYGTNAKNIYLKEFTNESAVQKFIKAVGQV